MDVVTHTMDRCYVSIRKSCSCTNGSYTTRSYTACSYTTYSYTTCSHTTCSHTACPSTSYSYTTCSYTILVHGLLVHDLLVHVPGTIPRGPGASRDAASSGDTGDAAYHPRSRAMAGCDQPIGFSVLLVVLPLQS